MVRVHANGGHTLRKDVLLPSKHLLSAFYETLPSKNPSKKHLLLMNLLRTLLRSVRLHDPLGVHPNGCNSWARAC